MTCGNAVLASAPRKNTSRSRTARLKRYIYYGCGRSKDKTCTRHKYLQEDELVEQLISLLDQIDFNQLGIEQKFEDELKRFNKFQRGVLGIANKGATHDDIDLKTYAKYIAQGGHERREGELMGCFKSKLKITEGVVTIEQQIMAPV